VRCVYTAGPGEMRIGLGDRPAFELEPKIGTKALSDGKMAQMQPTFYEVYAIRMVRVPN
jgi:hypothetical protein